LNCFLKIALLLSAVKEVKGIGFFLSPFYSHTEPQKITLVKTGLYHFSRADFSSIAYSVLSRSVFYSKTGAMR